MTISTNRGERVSTLVVTGAVGTTASPTYSSATPAVIPEMTVTITATGAHVSLRFDGSFTLLGGDAFDIALYRDGVALAGTARRLAFTDSAGVLDPAGSVTMPAATQTIITNETEGEHTYEARCARAGGTARAY